ncbi:hypothetical protein E2C01_088804 [Portunus trituberculatus]|uniref:Uncharacterized protein n=1 Tax=Portunus trituberculatus TaxID=210409 RepID=A0A5B7JHH0_PORTR|nr:hypothetical protein [Portunus trituberculatus]
MSLMEQRLYLLAEHVTRIDNKLSSMQKTLDTNSIVAPQDELVAAASESYRVGVDIPRIQSLEKVSVKVVVSVYVGVWVKGCVGE